jgi:hypothetical protein
MLEWKHHRELAREARTNILSETPEQLQLTWTLAELHSTFAIKRALAHIFEQGGKRHY